MVLAGEEVVYDSVFVDCVTTATTNGISPGIGSGICDSSYQGTAIVEEVGEGTD